MAFTQRLRSPALAFGAVLLASAPGARAQDDVKAFDRTPANCVSVATIDRTHAVDDRTILFFMRGRRVYRNYLAASCPNLARYDRIGYETRGSFKLARLCSGDAVSVLNSILDSTYSCRLGEFLPLSPDEVEDLTRKPDEARDTIEVKPVELPPAQDASADGSAKDKATADTVPPKDREN